MDQSVWPCKPSNTAKLGLDRTILASNKTMQIKHTVAVLQMEVDTGYSYLNKGEKLMQFHIYKHGHLTFPQKYDMRQTKSCKLIALKFILQYAYVISPFLHTCGTQISLVR